MDKKEMMNVAKAIYRFVAEVHLAVDIAIAVGLVALTIISMI